MPSKKIRGKRNGSITFCAGCCALSIAGQLSVGCPLVVQGGGSVFVGCGVCLVFGMCEAVGSWGHAGEA